MNFNRRLQNIEKALSVLGEKGNKTNCQECGVCYCWKDWKYNDCPNRMHWFVPENIHFMDVEEVRHMTEMSYAITNNKREELAEQEAKDKIDEYCGACGHTGKYELEMTFNIEAASGRPNPEWRNKLEMKIAEGKAKKRHEYFKKKRA